MNFEEAANIPGMIELVERKMLFSTVQSIPLEKNDCIVEFGPFFGRSTNCIAQGLLSNISYTSSCKFFTHDSFECDESGWFAPHVRRAAKEGNVENLLEVNGVKINFQKIFSHYMKSYLKTETVTIIKSELTNSQPSTEKIAFMHIDSPKYYEELKIILIKFFPQTKVGSIIVFQDFFYQWSATLILSVAILIDKNLLSLEESAATSLVCRIVKPPNAVDLAELDLIMQNNDLCEGYFDVAIKECNKIKLDRPESYLPKITLAKIQWQYSNGNFHETRKTIVKYLNAGNPIQIKILDNFLELLGNGFSIRHLFEKDHMNEDSSTIANTGKFEVDPPKK